MPLSDAKPHPQEKHKFRRFVRALFITISVIIIIAILAIYFFLSAFIKHQIIESVHRSSRGLYHVEIGNLHAKFWSGALSMTDVDLKQDTILAKKLTTEDTAFHMSKVHIKLDEVNISSIKWRNYIRNNNLKVGIIEITSPHFFLQGEIPKQNKEDIQESDKNFLDLLPGIIASFAGSLKIQQIKVNNGKLKYNLKVGKGVTKQTADHIDINVFEIEIDTISPHKALYSKDASLHFKNYKLVSPNQYYHLTIEDVNGKISDSVLTIQKLSFKQKDSTLKKDVLRIDITEVKGTGVNFTKLTQDKKIELSKLTFYAPDIQLKDTEKPKKSTFRKAMPELIPDFAKTFIDSLTMDTLSIQDGRMYTDVKNKQGHIIQHAENINLQLLRIFIDTLDTGKKFEYYNKAALSAKNYSISFTSNNSKISIGNINVSTVGKSVLLSNIRINQIHSHGPHQRYFFTNHIKSINFYDFNFGSLVNDQKVISERADINNMRLEIFLDEIKSKSSGYTHNMPQDLMEKIKFYILLKKVNIKNSYLFYSDKDPVVSKPANLSFEKINISTSNFTNDPKKMSAKTPAVFHGTAMLMGQSKLTINMTIPFLSKGFDCSYNGTIDRIEGRVFNDFMAFEGLSIERGQIEPSPFNINVVNGTAQGQLTFIYHDLHVKVFDKGTREFNKKKTVLNNFVIKNDNPQKKKNDPEVVQVSTSIDKAEDGFFYFLWKVLRIGIVKTMVKDSFYKAEEE
jgi:hypothetical protein